MVYRIYVEKKPGFDGEARQLHNELTTLLGIRSLTGLRLLNRYDVEGISEELFRQCAGTVFSEPPVDDVYGELPAHTGAAFAVEYLPGQFDQRADSAAECIQLISQGERPLVRSARVYLLDGELTAGELEEIKKYVINPVEAREASLDTRDTLQMTYAVPEAVATLTGFNELDEAGLKAFIGEKGLAMDYGDIKFCQDYFRSEQRDPTITEIKMIDTYWSDHCRHTTFGTILDDVQIDDAVVRTAFEREAVKIAKAKALLAIVPQFISSQKNSGISSGSSAPIFRGCLTWGDRFSSKTPKAPRLSAGFSPSNIPIACAHRNTPLMMVRHLFLASVVVVQMGFRHRKTSCALIASTGIFPSTGLMFRDRYASTTDTPRTFLS